MTEIKQAVTPSVPATNKTTNAVANAKKLQFSALLKSDAVQHSLSGTLGDAMKTKTFTSSLISAVSTNAQLRECDGMSIISAALLGESLKLSPSPQLGQYYMVPFNDKNKGKVATFQLGYKGMLQLAIRSGQYKRINVLPIKEGELVSYNALDEEIKVELISDEVAREKVSLSLPKTGKIMSFFIRNMIKGNPGLNKKYISQMKELSEIRKRNK